jgi:hypothetical protein
MQVPRLTPMDPFFKSGREERVGGREWLSLQGFWLDWTCGASSHFSMAPREDFLGNDRAHGVVLEVLHARELVFVLSE